MEVREQAKKIIERARNFAKMCLDDKLDNATKEDYFMFQISKFLLLKESMIKKDFDSNTIYFNVEENYHYLKAIMKESQF